MEDHGWDLYNPWSAWIRALMSEGLKDTRQDYIDYSETIRQAYMEYLEVTQRECYARCVEHLERCLKL